jgi:NAD(P)-dependent dehydrogenase (short-subunit alcohol dehydrogenase family)
MLITGGGTGIGRATALLCAREGARIIVGGRRSEPLQEVVKSIREMGGEATLARADITKPERVELMVQSVVYNFGGLDVLFNNAGTFAEGTAEGTDERRWTRVLDTNLKGAWLVSRLAIPAMRARGGGSIINNASIHGLIGMTNAAAYCASKGGLIQLTRAMALDHARDGIRVNAICPGVTDTALTRDADGGDAWMTRAVAQYPQGRPGTVDEIARLVLFLASDEASRITGAVIPVDGGVSAT